MHQDYYQCYAEYCCDIAIMIHFQIAAFWNTARVTLRPASVIQAEGFMVQFSCEIHLHFRDIKWSISDVYLSKYHPSDVIIRSQGHTSVMSITARAEFNGSAIRCVAVDMSFSFEVSNTAYLSVQGSYEFL